MNLTFAAQLNKMITAGLGGAVEAPETGVAVGRRAEYTSIGPAPILTFEANSELPLKDLSVNMEPIQDLHGQDAPYPAGGGKNIIDFKAVLDHWGANYTDLGNYSYKVTFIGTGYSDPYVFSDTNITVSLSVASITTDTGSNWRIELLDSADAIVGSISSDGGGTVPINKQASKIRLNYASAGDGATYTKVQIEKSSTATAFAPYSNICPISGRSEVNVWREATYDTSADPALTVQLGQTVYGGTVDVTSGVLTVDRAIIASYNGEPLPGEWISDRDAYAPGVIPTTGAQVCYELATPITVQLTPEQLTTVLGTNNVWSDADEVSLTYGNIYYTEGY